MSTIKQQWINFRVWLYMSYDIPQSWNELNDFQLKLIGRLLCSSDRLGANSFKLLLIAILVMKHPNIKYIFKVVYLYSKVPFSELIGYADFIFNENENLTRFIPKIKVGNFWNKKTLYGPGIRLNNISIEELSYVDAFYYNWIKDNKIINLQRLVACLYRPESKNPTPEDIREPFNKLLLPKNSILTDKIPFHIQYTIALAYQGSRLKLIARYPNVFPKPTQSEEEAPKLKKKSSYQPFSKIINAMAMDEVQVFGTLGETEKANAVQFLEIYEQTIINSRKK